MFKKILTNFYIKKYKKIGTMLGDMLSYSYMEAMGFEMVGKHKLILKFLKLEKMVHDLGYSPYLFNDFIAAGGYGQPLPELTKNVHKLTYQIDSFLLFELTHTMSAEEKSKFYERNGITLVNL